ncbi:MAG: HAMP domain-containing histidine kinase [Lachnospiraceae bacterium]|nr:HAMP domain-containing histidine kinase [Lachnospiraceae bacterium]
MIFSLIIVVGFVLDIAIHYKYAVYTLVEKMDLYESVLSENMKREMSQMENASKEELREKALQVLSNYTYYMANESPDGESVCNLDDYGFTLDITDKSGNVVPVIHGAQIFLEYTVYDSQKSIAKRINNGHGYTEFELSVDENKVVDLGEYIDDSKRDELLSLYKKKGKIKLLKLEGIVSEERTIIPTTIVISKANGEAMVLLDNQNPESQTLYSNTCDEYVAREFKISNANISTINTSDKLVKDAENVELTEFHAYNDFYYLKNSLMNESYKRSIWETYGDRREYVLKLSVDMNAFVRNELRQSLTEEMWLGLPGAIDVIWFVWAFFAYKDYRRETEEERRFRKQLKQQHRKQQKERRSQKKVRELFLNAMAHELKTPAAVIQNTAEYLESGRRPEKQTHYLHVLQEEAMHVNQLLCQMLTYTRMNERKYTIHPEKTDLRQLIEKRLLIFQDLLEEKQEKVEIVDDKYGEVWCDRRLTEMVLDNMITNVLKYGVDGGKLRITLRDNGVFVYNDGPQLSDEALESVWSPMYREDEARKSDGSSGMGLAISAEVLELQNGRYGVRNAENGVEFYFLLPVLPPKYQV